MSMSEKGIKKSFLDIFAVWKREFKVVISNKGVLIFFLLLPALYPLVYALIYNPEVVRDLPMVVVDDSRTPLSRELCRNIDATPNISIVSYCANMDEAKDMMNQKACYAVFLIPEDFSRQIGRGEQANVNLYSDMSMLMRYKNYLVGATEAVLDMGAQLQTKRLDSIGLAGEGMGKAPLNSFWIALGGTNEGFGTFLIPGFLIILFQQCVVLGIAMLGGASRERRKLYGYDPMQVEGAGIVSTMIGQALCYYLIFVVPAIYLLHYVPMIFSYPQLGSVLEIFIFISPMAFASIFMGMVMQVFVRESESVFLVLVASSIVFLFLSGLSWPRYAMSPFWILIGDCVPSTWGVDGFIRICSNGASLSEVAHPYRMLWLLSGAYFIVAYSIRRFIYKR